jgi:hypothetical protein
MLTATAVKIPGIIGWNVTTYNPSAGSAQLVERKD